MKVTIPLNIADIEEPKPVPAGKKYDLVVASYEDSTDGGGSPQLRVLINIEGHDIAPAVTHFLSLPSSRDDVKKLRGKGYYLRTFLDPFKIPYESQGDQTEFDTDDLIGARANLELTLSEPDKNNRVYNRLVLPRLVDTVDQNPIGRVSPKPPKR